MTAVMGTKMIRKEDPKLLTGEGKYIDDIHAPGELWMGMVRSTMAHAVISSIDTSGAEAMPGVHAVYTGQQLSEMGLWLAPLPCAWPVTEDMVNPPHHPVAIGEVNHVGEIVAIVLADSRYGAADAAEEVVVASCASRGRLPPTRTTRRTKRSIGHSTPTRRAQPPRSPRPPTPFRPPSSNNG